MYFEKLFENINNQIHSPNWANRALAAVGHIPVRVRPSEVRVQILERRNEVVDTGRAAPLPRQPLDQMEVQSRRKVTKAKSKPAVDNNSIGTKISIFNIREWYLKLWMLNWKMSFSLKLIDWPSLPCKLYFFIRSIWEFDKNKIKIIMISWQKADCVKWENAKFTRRTAAEPSGCMVEIAYKIIWLPTRFDCTL